MKKIKFIIIPSIIMVLLGALAVSITIEILNSIVKQNITINLYSLIDNFETGIVCGVIIVVIHLLIQRFKKKQFLGYLIGTIAILLLIIALYVHNGLLNDYWKVDLQWFIILIIVESLTIPLTAIWYHKTILYNNKLEQKKETLKNKNS